MLQHRFSRGGRVENLVAAFSKNIPTIFFTFSESYKSVKGSFCRFYEAKMAKRLQDQKAANI